VGKIGDNGVGLGGARQAVGARFEQAVYVCISRKIVHALHQVGIGWGNALDVAFTALRAERDGKWITHEDEQPVIEDGKRDDESDQGVDEEADA